MTTWNAFYIGKQPRIDPDEGNNTAEDAADLLNQTFGRFRDELFRHVVRVTPINRGGLPNYLDQDQSVANDRFTVDFGRDDETYQFDATVTYEAEIVHIDGTSIPTTIRVFQSTNGETFLAPGLVTANGGAFYPVPVQSITLKAIVADTLPGLPIDPTISAPVPCFVKGTMILTQDGPCPVEDLRPGDLVETLDCGVRPLRWVGGRVVAGTGALAPIRFAPGALGNDRELLVSPQHRMLLSGWRAELLFGAEEVLVAAKALVNGDTIHIQPKAQVSYHHILFGSHQIVLANGVLSESFHPGAHILEGNQAIRAELLAIFPELDDPGTATAWDTARTVIKTHEARLLA